MNNNGYAIDDPLYESVYVKNKNRFKNGVLSSKEVLEKALRFFAELESSNFLNGVSLYFQSQDMDIAPKFLKPLEFWENKKVEINPLYRNSSFEVISSHIFNDEKIYSKKHFYDITQTKISLDDIAYQKIEDANTLFSRLKDSISSSNFNCEQLESIFSSNKLDHQEKLIEIVNYFSEYYFFSNKRQKDTFRFMFLHKLNLSSSLDNETYQTLINTFDTDIKMAVSVLNTLNRELFLQDICFSISLETPFYEKLGTKNATLNKNFDLKYQLPRQNAKEYQCGLNIKDFNFKDSKLIAKRILDNETVQKEVNYVNLFLCTTKLNILTGEYAGESFVVEGDLELDPLKQLIADEFLSKIVAKDMIKNLITIRKNNAVRRNKEFLSREHQNNPRQLHEGEQTISLQTAQLGESSSKIRDRESERSDDEIVESDGTWFQRSRSMGDSEQGNRLFLESHPISIKYRHYFEDAIFGTFTHTQTREILDILRLNKKLTDEEFKNFNKYLSRNNFGYYSRVAKAFIIRDKSLIEFYQQTDSQQNNLETTEKNSSSFWNNTTKITLKWNDFNADTNIEFYDFQELQKYYLALNKELFENERILKSKLEIALSNEVDNDIMVIDPEIIMSLTDGNFNPFSITIKEHLSDLYKNGLIVHDSKMLIPVSFEKIAETVQEENYIDVDISYNEDLKEKESAPFSTSATQEVIGLEEDNFAIEEDISLGGSKTKFRNYVAGIDIVRKIEAGEPISVDEKIILSKMGGIGAIAQAFYRTDGSAIKGWENEAAELKAILTEEEYREAQRATLDAYYTDEVIARAMWRAIERFGFSRGSAIEPSVGIGNFFGFMPKKFKQTTQLVGIEINSTSAKVAQILYPKAKIFNVGFEKFNLTAGAKASLVIGNPPFGGHKIIDESIPLLNGKSIHNYFMGKSVNLLEDGGVMAMVVSSSFLDSSDASTRTYIADQANFIGAIRLPKGSFSNANTEVVTDIVFFQKKDYRFDIQNIQMDWLHIGELNDTPINKYYEKHPENLLGEWGKFGTMYRGDEACLVAKEGQDTEILLSEAIDRLPSYLNFDNGKYYYGVRPLTDGTVTSSNTLMDFVGFNNRLAESLKSEGDKISSNARVNTYFRVDNDLYMKLPYANGESSVQVVKTRMNSTGEEVELKASELERIFAMIEVAEIATKVKDYQLIEGFDEDFLEETRKKLGHVYDKFVKKYGFLNNRTNSKLFEDDVRSPFLLALETKYEQGISPSVALKNGVDPVKENATKADIFFKRTQKPFIVPTHAASIKDAFNICLSEKAFVDLEFIASLVSESEDEVMRYLSDGNFIFDDDVDGWVTKEEYLSGNVKEKLKNTQNPKNIEALKTVIPADIDALDIDVSCGASWIPVQDMNNFIADILGTESVESYYLDINASWSIKNRGMVSPAKQELYGTSRRTVQECLLAALNNRQITVYDTIGEGESLRKVINHDETTVANSKVDDIKERWNDWIWDTAERRDRLGKLYNEKFNVYAPRHFDGSHLKLHGKVSDDIIEHRPHQKNAVWRVLQTGKALLDHTVGSGKTFTAIACVMELKRTGRANKTLVAVPKHLTSQWGKEWLQLYPNANILVATEKDFSAKRRKNLMAKIATGDWDAVIIAHSQLSMIENDKEFQEKFLRDEISKIQDAIDAIRLEEGKDARNIKNFMKTQENLTARLTKLLSTQRDDNFSFLELGIDSFVVDEFHEFKNLQFHTALNNVRGLGNPLGSKKAFDIYLKIQSLLEKTNGKNFIALTGTPISNSISEMFTLERYLNAEALRYQKLDHFDAWSKQYANILTDWELKPSGGYKLVTRMSKFKNIPELIGSYRDYADVVSIEDVKEALAKQGKVLDIPPVKGGCPKNFIVERSDVQARFIGVKDENGQYPKNSLVYRSEHLPTGKPQKGDDNILVIMNDARKCSLDMRVIDPSYPDFEGSKVNVAIQEMLQNYHKWDKLKGTQLMFCDLSTPKGCASKERERLINLEKLADSGDEDAIKELDNLSMDDIEALNSSFSVYDDMKDKLVNAGVPEYEIAFIHEADTPKKKEELFSKVNSGTIRFLFGSTSKMGAGMNVQKRLIALHHLDVPWRPSDLEQREGRIIRQGNLLFTLFAELSKDEKERNSHKLNRVIEELGFSAFDLDYIIANKELYGEKFEIEINRYATKNSLDSGLWEKIETKARFIAQLRKGLIKDREIEDISGEEANAAEIKAASSGDPLVLEEMRIKQRISKLEANKRNFKRGVIDREFKINQTKSIIQNYPKQKQGYQDDLILVKNYQKEMLKKAADIEKIKKENKENDVSNKDIKDFSGFEVEINGVVFNSREDVGALIIENARKLNNLSRDTLDIGHFAGFELSIEKGIFLNCYCVVLSGAHDYQFEFKLDEAKALGLASRMTNLLQRPEIDGLQADKIYQFNLLELPKLEALEIEFPQEEELKSLKKRHAEIINYFKKMDEESRKNRSHDNGTTNNDNSSKDAVSTNNWIDPNKEAPLEEILGTRVDLSILDKITDFKIVGKCFVLTNQLEREDYLKFEKIFKKFGGEWDTKKSAIVFSEDGIARMQSLMEEQQNSLNTIALQYNPDEHGGISEYFKSYYIDIDRI